MLAYTQPPATLGLQLSVVQGLLSLHTVAVPDLQVELLQTSLTVHALPSVQDAVLATCVQPLTGSQPNTTYPATKPPLAGNFSAIYWMPEK